MFALTVRERVLVIFVLASLLTGALVRHWRHAQTGDAANIIHQSH